MGGMNQTEKKDPDSIIVTPDARGMIREQKQEKKRKRGTKGVLASCAVARPEGPTTNAGPENGGAHLGAGRG